MINLSYPELQEISNPALPPAHVENALIPMRNRLCEGSRGGFKLQSQQRFLRRVLSPDSPVQSVLVVHGTGTGKTCTAIQIAEEYILRPEFQDKKVLVVSTSAVQENFQRELFDIGRVSLDETRNVLESKQCTGRRYLDMLMRIESEPKNWADPDIRNKLERTATRIIEEFYEFSGYITFGSTINVKSSELPKKDFEQWIHDTYDNRLIIIDEAHAIREKGDMSGAKESAAAIKRLTQIANGVVLVLLSATPMFDTYDEIVFLLNLFLWNDKKQPETASVKASYFFNDDASLKEGEGGERFRALCSDYISFVRGENPFTFPFRLPAPNTVTASEGIAKAYNTEEALLPQERLQYLSLVPSIAQGDQSQILKSQQFSEEGEELESQRKQLMEATVAVLPNNKRFRDVFRTFESQYEYVGDPFLTPANLANISAKFVSIIKSIQSGEGIVLVYSNYVEMGVKLLAMALEEHGFTPESGKPLLRNPSYKGESKGVYALLTSAATPQQLASMINKSRSLKNKDGESIRVLLSSPIVSEGITLKYVRQVHIIDPWWNMSRIEQVIGRGLRNCSHRELPFEKQNCTVYLHTIRRDDGVECFDEYTYRTRIVPKAMKIAKVRRVIAESAMDCPIQKDLNTLPEDWRNLRITQKASERNREITLPLHALIAPNFDSSGPVTECKVPISDEVPEHVRPLSTYVDTKEEVLEKLEQLLIDKPIWDRKDLLAAMKSFKEDVVIYNIQQAIASGHVFRDAFGRAALLESRGDMYALLPKDTMDPTMVGRTTKPPIRAIVPLPLPQKVEKPVVVEVPDDILAIRKAAIKFPPTILARFDEKTINGYVFDTALSDAERIAYLKAHRDKLPFGDRLVIPDTEILVLGHDRFEPNETLVGEERTQFEAWNAALLKRFIDNKDTLFATITKGRKFAISKPREKTMKRYEPIVCGTGIYTLDQTKKFAKMVDKNGEGIPDEIAKARDPICMYTELLAREEHNCIWLTPEEWSVLFQDETNKKAWTKEFKK